MIPNDVEEILSTKTGLKRYIFIFFVIFILSVFFLFVSYRSCPHGRCVGRAARPVLWGYGILAAEAVANTLLWSGSPLDGRSELGHSDQAAGHGFQVGVQKVWVGLLWTDPY